GNKFHRDLGITIRVGLTQLLDNLSAVARKVGLECAQEVLAQLVAQRWLIRFWFARLSQCMCSCVVGSCMARSSAAGIISSMPSRRFSRQCAHDTCPRIIIIV